MEVKPGYKQTEVGVIPEEWEAAQIGDVCSFSGGSQPPRSTFKFAPTPGYIRLIQIRDYKSDDFASYIPEVLARKRCTSEDIMIGRYGPPIFQILRGIEGAYNVALIKTTPTPKVDREFFFSVLNQEPLFQLIEALSRRSSGQTGVEMPALKAYGLPLPPLPEQRAIATALSDVDGLLGGLDRLIAKKRDLKQAAMQQLLTGQTRLPGFSPEKASFRQTEVGVIPDDWKLTRLVDLVDPSRGIRYGIVQPGNYDPQGRYMIRGQDYSEVKGWANPTDVFRVSPGIEGRYRNSRVKTGDLIMTIVGYCGHVEMTPEWLDGANLTQTTARIAIQPDKAVSAFCKYMLLCPTGRNQVAAYMKGAAQPGLNCGDVEKFLIPIPPRPEQTAIAEVLTEMDAELAALEQRREKTRALKQAMMQELLTGRTRLV